MISILGTGNMGKALVKSLSPHVDTILWGSREPREAEKLAAELGLRNVVCVPYKEVLDSSILIPAFKFQDVLAWGAANREALRGKIVIDISNPFNDDYSGYTTSWGESSAEEIQRALPDSRVVGAFKNTFFKVFDEPVFRNEVSDVLVTSDDDASKSQVMTLLKPLSYRFIDAGKLSNNRTIERFTLLELEISSRYGSYPYISLQMFGIKDAVIAK